MAPEEALRDEARFVARNMLSSKEAEAEIVEQRFYSYLPRMPGGQGAPIYQCPRCWIRDNRRSSLRPVHGTQECDVMRCNHDACGAEFVIPFEE